MDNKKNAVFIILGQSNAVGHKVPMKEQDKILSPMKNVFGLCREFNQSFDNKFLTWGGYTSFGMNLAEEQDNTYSVPNFLASIWQNHIDEGNKNNLPDLYIIQIAIGAQGVREGAMWYPDRKEKLIPGKLGVVDISLFAIFVHIFKSVTYAGYIYIATVLARAISSFVNYLVNKNTVFKNKSNNKKEFVKSLVGYYILVIINVAVSGVCVNFIAKSLSWNETLVKFLVDMVLFVCNYVIQREFIFKNKRKSK